MNRPVETTLPDGRVSTNAYDLLGRLTARTGAGSVPVAYRYDPLGRMTNLVDGVSNVTVFAYDPLGRLLTKTYTDASAYAYAYNARGWLTNRVDALGRATAYAYKPSSDLPWKTTYGTGDVIVTRLYDDLDRLTNITSVSSVSSASSVVNSFSYTLDATGRRTQRQDVDGSHTDWGYDFFDQLATAARTNSPNGAADAAYRYQYQYDLVGNRLQEKRGPEDDPLERQLTLDGTHNNLNQLTARDWSGKLPIHGSVEDSDTILLVQGVTNAPSYWNGTNWLAGATLAAGSNLVDIVSVLGTNSVQTDITLFMPPDKPQAFLYDLNGNLTNDGYRVYTWDEENRLAAIETAPASVATGIERRRSEYLYDAQWRRIFKTDYAAWDGSAFAETNVTRFVWDGWLLLAELTYTQTHTLTNYYTWGLDLSQSLQGAGGIDGMLAHLDGTDQHLFTYDGNGNVTDILDDTGTVVAHYEYDPFGRTVAQSGAFASVNRWRFSTKQIDDTWGLYYYGYRFYSPELGRWLNRDPIGERSGVNLITTCKNNPINVFDLYGLAEGSIVFPTNPSLMFYSETKSQHPISDRHSSTTHTPLWLWEPIVSYDRYDWQRMRLTEELMLLCPIVPTLRHNRFRQSVCCEPDVCKAEASVMARSYTDALRFAEYVRVVKMGSFVGNVFICLLGGNRADGTMYPEDIYSGLVCGGWEAMARAAVETITNDSYCWSYSTRLNRKATHTWGELASVHGSVIIDPYPSGGVTYWP